MGGGALQTTQNVGQITDAKYRFKLFIKTVHLSMTCQDGC